MTKPQHPRIVPPSAMRALASRRSPIATVNASATVAEALQRMQDTRSDAVAVMDDERLAGVFSEHDFARLGLAGGTTAMPVRDTLSPNAVVANPDDSAEHCLQLMAEHDITHLPVVDGQRVLGLLSRCDLLAELAAHGERVFTAIDLDQRVMFKRGTYSC